MAELKIVLPGNTISLSTPKVGPGLYVPEKGCNDAVVSVAGLLRGVGPEEEEEEEVRKKKKNTTTWVDYSAKRYVPFRGDRVVGVVKNTGRVHRIDIGSAMPSFLPELSFEGATKRNKPNLQVGEVVYARICHAHKDMESELSCVDGSSGKAGGLGQLPVGGYLLHCSMGLARKLLSKPSPVLEALGKQFKFEVTVGMNGLVWVNSGSLVGTIAICNAIKNSEYMSPGQCRDMVKDMAHTIGRQ